MPVLCLKHVESSPNHIINCCFGCYINVWGHIRWDFNPIFCSCLMKASILTPGFKRDEFALDTKKKWSVEVILSHLVLLEAVLMVVWLLSWFDLQLSNHVLFEILWFLLTFGKLGNKNSDWQTDLWALMIFNEVKWRSSHLLAWDCWYSLASLVMSCTSNCISGPLCILSNQKKSEVGSDKSALGSATMRVCLLQA